VKRLRGQVAVVTGASRGIGRAIALTLAREGARVVVNYARSRESGEAVVAEEALAIRADVSRAEEVDRLLESTLEKFGRCHAWVNNAGADILTGDARTWPAERQWDEVMGVDLKGTWICSRAAAEVMRRDGGGVIVNLSWDHVSHGMGNPTAAIYAAAKGGVAAMSRCLAREFAPAVRVNVVAPGWIRTQWLDGARAEIQQRVTEATPLARPGTPGDVAGAVAFLASAEASFITGQTLVVNGGVVMA
jgi:3-oxoacyl-[acyl-carrier protein] reductase